MDCANDTDCTGNSTPVRLETLTPSAVMKEKLGRMTINKENVRAALGTPTLVEWDLKAPRSETAVRRGRKSMRNTVSRKRGAATDGGWVSACAGSEGLSKKGD